MSRNEEFKNAIGMPEEQVAAETADDSKTALAELAKKRAPGTHIFRSERRSSTDGSIGMHWTANSGVPFTQREDDSVVWHGEITDPESIYPPNHPFMRSYKLAPAPWEAEVRFRPGSSVQLRGVWKTDPEVPKSERTFAPGWPAHHGYTYEPINEQRTVENKGHIVYPVRNEEFGIGSGV